MTGFIDTRMPIIHLPVLFLRLQRILLQVAVDFQLHRIVLRVVLHLLEQFLQDNIARIAVNRVTTSPQD